MRWLILMLALSLAGSPGFAQYDSDVGDQLQIKELIAAFDKAWNAKDWEAVGRLYGSDAFFGFQRGPIGRGGGRALVPRVMSRLGGIGRRAQNWVELEPVHDRDSAGHPQIETRLPGLKLVAPDLAFAVLTAVDPEVSSQVDSFDTFVVRKIDGKWLIASSALARY